MSPLAASPMSSSREWGVVRVVRYLMSGFVRPDNPTSHYDLVDVGGQIPVVTNSSQSSSDPSINDPQDHSNSQRQTCLLPSNGHYHKEQTMMNDNTTTKNSKRHISVPISMLQALRRMKPSKNKLLVEKDEICLIRESPFRIFKAAEAGRLSDVERLYHDQQECIRVRNKQGRTVVHIAACHDQDEVLRLLVSFGADLDTKDHEGNTPLHCAVMNDALKAIDVLVSSGADAGILNNRQHAPIHLATELNKAHVLQQLVSYLHRIDIVQPGDHGRTALHIAAIHDFDQCARVLLNNLRACPRRTCDNGFYPIHEAARHASSKTMQVFLEWSESKGIDRAEMMKLFDAEGNVPLHSAVHSGDIKAVELCLSSGAKISTQQHDLSTPVHLAAAQGTLHLVRLMFRMQPDERRLCLSTADAQKMTPLHCAAMFDHNDVVQYLISEGADIETRDKEDRTPLLLAASRSAWKTVHVLLGLGACPTVVDGSQRNVLHHIVLNGGRLEEFCKELTQLCQQLATLLDERDSSGCTPLHYASRHGHIRSLKDLILLGACVSLKNHQNENPLHFAARYGRYQTVRQLLDSEKGAAIINESDGNGMTPLHIASQEGHCRVVQLFLNRGALLHRDHLGRTPLHLAAMAGHTDTLQLLLSVHSHLLDQQDKEGNTALHLATMENKPNAISALLTLNCKLLANNKGLFAIDYAIHYKNQEAALALVTHEERADEIMLNRSEKTPCVAIALIGALPRVTEAVLDRCIVRANCKTDSKSFYVKYIFRYLQMPPERLDMYRKLHNDPKWRPEPLCTMNAMVRHGRVELLSHPLSKKFLEFKWHSYGMYFHLANLLLYLIFLGCVTLFSADVMMSSRSLPDVIHYNSNSSQFFNGSDGPLIRKPHRYSKEYFQASNTLMTYMCGIIILVYIGVSAFGEVCHMIQQTYKSQYILDLPNIISWLLYVTATIMVSPVFYGTYEPINYSCAAIATFLSWFNLLIYLQRFDHVGIYVVMFLEVLKTLLLVLLVFSILIIAFGLAFYILLSEDNHIAFSNMPLSLLRTFSMMLGEIDFLGTFVRPLYTPMEQTGKQKELHQTSFLILCLFMVLMPILLMNLLIGLAVGDIESVRRNAQLKRMAKQVELHTDLERKLPQFILDRVDKMELIEYPNNRLCERKGLLASLMKRIFHIPMTVNDGQPDADDINSEETSEDNLLEEIFHQKRKLKQITNLLESQSQLLRLIVQKMEIRSEADELDEGVQKEDLRPVSAVSFSPRPSSRSPRLAFLRRSAALSTSKL